MNQQTWYNIRAAAEGETDVMIYDEVGGWGISAELFIKELKAIKTPTINLHLNTPGGSVFDGMAISNTIKSHKSHITGYIDGLAASIGSVIAVSCDDVKMAANSFMMVHNPQGFVMGPASDMRKTADLLDKLKVQIARSYADKSGKDEGDVSKWMDDETWFNAEEALAAGLADFVIESAEVTNCFDVSKFSNPPKALIEQARRSAGAAGIKGEFKMAKQKKEEPKAMAPNTDEGHDDFMKRCQDEGNDAETCQMYWDDDTEAKAQYKRGYQQAVADNAKPATVNELKAAFPDDSGFVIDQLGANATIAQAKAAYVDIVKARLAETNKRADEMAVALAKATKGQAAIQDSSSGKTEKGDGPTEPKAKAKWEWDNNPKVREGFSCEANYIYARAAELDGSHKNYSRQPQPV